MTHTIQDQYILSHVTDTVGILLGMRARFHVVCDCTYVPVSDIDYKM